MYAIILSAVLLAGCNDANRMITGSDTANELSLWYNEPANLAKWEQSVPIGNGRLGAMVFGGVEKERIQFNCDTLFTGKPHDYAHKGAVKYLSPIRKLLYEGKQNRAA
jgi:alpha-L-fucosidase 2